MSHRSLSGCLSAFDPLPFTTCFSRVVKLPTDPSLQADRSSSFAGEPIRSHATCDAKMKCLPASVGFQRRAALRRLLEGPEASMTAFISIWALIVCGDPPVRSMSVRHPKNEGPAAAAGIVGACACDGEVDCLHCVSANSLLLVEKHHLVVGTNRRLPPMSMIPYVSPDHPFPGLQSLSLSAALSEARRSMFWILYSAFLRYSRTCGVTARAAISSARPC